MTSKKEAKFRNRTIYYFRCDFLVADDVKVVNTLEQMVAASWDQLDSTASRTFAASNGKQLVGMKISFDKAKLSTGDKNCTLFSVGLYEEGASANTIPKPSTTQSELEAATHDAPLHQEFLDGKGFVCLYGNHIVISPTDTLRVGTINGFIESLIFKGGFKKEAAALDIQQIANIDNYRTIKNEGVKNITINSSAYLSTLYYLERHKPNFSQSSKIQKITNLAKSWMNALCDDDTEEEICESENLNARIVISHDARSTTDSSDQGGSRLKDTALSLIETDLAGYVIVTKTGKKLTHEEIVLKNTVKVTAHGKSVRRQEMWGKLIKSIEQYDKDGILEQ